MKSRRFEFSKSAPYIIRNDQFLKLIYFDVYKTFFEIAGYDKSLKVLELGAGGYSPGDNFWRDIVASDIDQFGTEEEILQIDSSSLPFDSASFDLVIAKDALHHFKDPISSLEEIFRVLKSDGKFLVSEPYWSPLGRFVFRFLHTESWDVNVKSPIIDSHDPWDGNQALLLLLTSKFKPLLQKMSPPLNLEVLFCTYGISYLLSGGVHTRTVIPSRILIKLYEWESNSALLKRIFGLNVIASFELRKS